MRNFLLPFLLLFASLSMAQNPVPASASNPFDDQGRNPIGHCLNARHQVQEAISAQPELTLSNLRAYTQSIHNCIAKWDAGSAYRFDFGTSPGTGNIYAGHAFNASQRNSIGHSFADLQNYASAQGTNFQIGDTFYLNIYETNQSPVQAHKLVFEWENLGAPSNAVNIIIETNYGVNGASPFTPTEASQMMAFYSLVNPIVKEVYGPPARNHDVTIVNDAYATSTNTYYNGPNQVSTSFRVNADGDLDQPRLMIHELIHAYRDNVTLSSDSTWHYDPELSGFEEGMAEGVALIVMDIFSQRYPNFWNGDAFKIHWNHSRGMPFSWNYDFHNHSQITTEDFFSTSIATGSHWERYGTAATAMRKAYMEDSLFFVNFNQEYYQRMNQNHNLLPSRGLCVDIMESVLPQIERTPTGTWIDQQRILDCRKDLRKKVYMLTFESLSWSSYQHDNRLHFLETHQNGSEWYWQAADSLGQTEVPNTSPQAIWSFTHQMNHTPGNVDFIRDWDGSLFRSKSINANAHWINEQPNGNPAYIGTPLLGPYQGPNPWWVGNTFTRDHRQDNCTAVPGCGKRAWAIGSQKMYTSTSDLVSMWPQLVSQGGTIPDDRAELDMNESGLFRFEVEFDDTQGPMVNDSYYRLLGDSFIDVRGVFGGLFKAGTDLIDGRMIIEHEDFGAEADISLFNNAFLADRQWTSILESNPQYMGGRNDRHYVIPGKVHGLYLNLDCSEKKMDFRNVGYGDGLRGTEMLLFNVDAMEDVVFTAFNDTVISVGEDFSLAVSNNFPDIFSGDSRVSYRWKDPSGNFLSNDTSNLITNAALSDSGTYTVEIHFFGCLIFEKQVEVTVNDTLGVSIESGELENRKLNLWPNPAEDNVFLELEGDFLEGQEVWLTDGLGRKFQLNPMVQGERIVLDVSNLSSGVYQVEIKVLDKLYSAKLIVR